MKKLIMVLMCLLICAQSVFATPNKNMQDSSNNGLTMEELSHVVSGSGTFEDPYVLDGTDNILQKYAESKLQEANELGISTYASSGQYNGTLSGTSHYVNSSKYNGANWRYESGGTFDSGASIYYENVQYFTPKSSQIL